MSKRKVIADPERSLIVDHIDDLVDNSRENLRLAKALADLLNALDTSGDKIEIDSNVIVGVFKKATP